MTASLPDGPLVAWYGDDFTGSAAVMEVLAFSGLPSVLFLSPPSREELARFSDFRGIGIAGIARSQPPTWMDAHLPAVFNALRRSGAPIVHYKTCSTLDSAPHIGSIGRAYDIAKTIFDPAWTPLVTAAPSIGRYQLFGNLFARAGEHVHRLDRHPTMSRHPATPMDEADVALHVSRQTGAPIRLVDIVALHGGHAESALGRHLAEGPAIVSLDMLEERSLEAVGRLIWRHRGRQLLALGSQGVEYALVAHWRAIGAVPPAPAPHTCRAERIAVVSGSCAPDTARQIEAAIRKGVAPIAFDASKAVDERALEGEIERALAEGLAALATGRSVVVHTALGPADPAVAAFGRATTVSGIPAETVNARLGRAMGRVLAGLIEGGGLRRGAIFGGDTSGHAMSELDIFALTAEAPLVPGAALLGAHSRHPAFHGLQLVLKGGQMGPEDFFHIIESGGYATEQQGVPA